MPTLTTVIEDPALYLLFEEGKVPALYRTQLLLVMP